MKTCKDFEHTGIYCCMTCHEDEEQFLQVVTIDAIPSYVCCQLISFFYPDDAYEKLSPEEKLLRAIFGEGPHRRITYDTKND